MRLVAALLLAGLLAAPASTLALLLSRRHAGRLDGPWPWLGRLVSAVVGTALLAAAVGGALDRLGVGRHHVAGAIAGLAVVSLVWLPATRQWTARAHLCWTSTVLLFAAYLVFMLQWTFASHLGVAGTAGSLLLWALEVWAALLGCAYLWELCDALGRATWRRRVTDAAIATHASAGYQPFVTLQVPAYNEPPEMVIDTLRSLLAMDYERYEVVCIDDNSTDEALWRPVEAWCRDHGVRFAHLEDWPGYKSGALNYALNHLTSPDTEIIGVVDADYQLDPSFLRECVPLFEDPNIGFIQAPQDYRDWEHAPFYRRLFFSYRYFFAVSQPSRNERDGAIFAGTTGLIRQKALTEVGGWDEWCITEDAELSLRILRAGYSGLHVDRSYGRGIMPLTFEALKGQRFRWCFGGIQILRRHWRSMLPGAISDDNHLTTGQRWAYLSGALQWYGDLLAMTFFLLLLVGAANVALGGGLLFRRLTGYLIATIPFMAALGIVRAVALVSRGTGSSWREALGAFMVWQSTTVVVARACVQGLFAREAEFLRTPKTGDAPRWSDAVRGNIGETLLALAGIAGIVAAATHAADGAGTLTAALLLWPTLAFAAAPMNSLAARRASLPPQLQARRRSESIRTGRGRRTTIAASGVIVAAGAASLIALLALGAPVAPPRIVPRAEANTTTTADHPTTSAPPTTAARGTTAPSAATSTTVAATTTTKAATSTTAAPTSTTRTTSAPAAPAQTTAKP